MPITFILSIILLLAGMISWVLFMSARRRYKKMMLERGDEDRDQRNLYATDVKSLADLDFSRKLRFWIMLCSVVLSVILLLFASSKVVSTKNVGIEKSFGKPVATLGNGFHLTPPWHEVAEMDAAIQTDNYTQSNKNCVTVRIAHQSVACVDATARWRIIESAAAPLYRDFRGFENVRDSLVQRGLNAALNNVLGEYDPLAVNEDGTSDAPSLDKLSEQVTQVMRDRIGSQVEVIEVMIPVIHFDEPTQGRINALQAQIAQTRIAQQASQTAAAQADANRTLSASVSNDPNVLVSRCFDLMSEMIAKGQAVPVGFTCWPGSGSAVVIPAATTTSPPSKTAEEEQPTK